LETDDERMNGLENGLPAAERISGLETDDERMNGLGNGLPAAERVSGCGMDKTNERLADVVIPVPDSSIPAAIGFSRVSGIPYNDGFVKNRYVGRTFIEPTDSLRKRGVGMKFNVISENVLGKRVIVIDDSIVRGNTTGPLIQLLRQAGAKEVHVCITCPPISHPCFMGVDMGNYEDLIAHNRSVEEIRRQVGADSLTYLSLEGMMRAVGSADGYCQACFTGKYPVPVDLSSVKTGFERFAR
jgi:amidophosphoribosyltransferase